MTESTSRRALVTVLALSLAFRAWLSVQLPFTADEAYFLLWGRHPDIGFYDHPPLIGWWLALVAPLSEATWALRAAATLLPAALALMVRAALRGGLARDPVAADWAAVCVLLVPLSVWNVFITTDTPLALFVAAAVLAFARAAQAAASAAPARAYGLALIAGVALGFAFLSKYFAVLVGLAFLVWTLSVRVPGRFALFGLVFVAALPFGLLNLYWNVNACWSNVMFNAFNRHDAPAASPFNPPLYLLTLAYLVAPLAWYGWRLRREAGWRSALRDPAAGVLLAAWLVPFAVLGALSFGARIGLHWLQAFVPLVVLSVALAAGSRALASSARVFGVLAVLHVIAALLVAALPLDTWRLGSLGPRVALLRHAHELPARVAAEIPGAPHLAADAYSLAALLAYHARRDVPVFGTGSTHARHDDLLTDWRRYAGKDLVIVRREAPRDGDVNPYFQSVEVRRIEFHGATLHLVLGRGFKFEAYRSGILEQVRARFYDIPGWLPMRRCYFCERYFGGASCRVPR